MLTNNYPRTKLGYDTDVSGSQDDVFLAFIPMFHIYGLVFFGLGLLCVGVTTILMQKYDFQAMVDGIQKHKVNNNGYHQVLKVITV